MAEYNICTYVYIENRPNITLIKRHRFTFHPVKASR